MVKKTILLESLVEHASSKDAQELQDLLESLGIEIDDSVLAESKKKTENEDKDDDSDDKDKDDADKDDDEEDDDEDDDDSKKESRDYTKENESLFESAQDLYEHLDKVAGSDFRQIVEAQGYSTEFLEKTETLFEHALNARIRAKETELEEEYANLSEAYIQEHIIPQVDEYLSYVAENYIENNSEAIESQARQELAENFINGIKGVFEENYVEVPESKVDLVQEKENKVAELSEQLNEQLNENKDLSKRLRDLERKDVVQEMSSDLSDNQKDKLAELAESVDFESREKFEKKVSDLKESYFPKASTEGDDDNLPGTGRNEGPESLDESQQHISEDEGVNKYAQFLAGMKRG